MSFCREKETRCFFLFLVSVAILSFVFGLFICHGQTKEAKKLFLSYESAVAGTLLEQGVSEELVAAAVTSKKGSDTGKDFLTKIGVTEKTEERFLPFLPSFGWKIGWELFSGLLALSLLLFGGSVFFFRRRERLYADAVLTIKSYMEDDFSCHLPQLYEGGVYEMFSAIEQLARMLRSKNEAEQRAGEFLKRTISDISHQLKTPLAALGMYQEIIEEEPENIAIVLEFSVKIKAALTRMERLIQSMLKITRLDAGSILFEKRRYQVSEIVRYALGELTARAKAEGKELTIEGDESETLVCDMEWTAEAIGNLVKNALDHTVEGNRVRVSWEGSVTMLRLSVSDNGCGISDEDIHHIFKRFYRSRHCPDAQGIGLGLPLAKAIVEGQEGVLSVESSVGEGTMFTVSLPYETVS